MLSEAIVKEMACSLVEFLESGCGAESRFLDGKGLSRSDQMRIRKRACRLRRQWREEDAADKTPRTSLMELLPH